MLERAKEVKTKARDNQKCKPEAFKNIKTPYFEDESKYFGDQKSLISSVANTHSTNRSFTHVNCLNPYAFAKMVTEISINRNLSSNPHSLATLNQTISDGVYLQLKDVIERI